MLPMSLKCTSAGSAKSHQLLWPAIYGMFLHDCLNDVEDPAPVVDKLMREDAEELQDGNCSMQVFILLVGMKLFLFMNQTFTLAAIQRP